jgi:hypothetical protein
MRSRNVIAGWFAVLALAGCVSTNAVQLGQPHQYPPVNADEVQVFQKESDVKADFDKVAIIHAEGDYTLVNDEKMINAMKKKAAKLGANAIIIEEFKDPSTVEKIADAVIGVGGEKKGKVLAIRLKS